MAILPRFLLRWVIVIGMLFQLGCSTVQDREPWGANASLQNWQRIKTSAKEALYSPHTWVPAAGALLFSMGSIDEEVSEWAVEKTPLFGSIEDADNASDDLKKGLRWLSNGTALITPSGDSAGTWALNKLKGFAVEAVAFNVVEQTTDLLKSETNRTRPNGLNDRSFVSGHATQAFTSATLASRNTEYLAIGKTYQRIAKISYTTLAAGTAWARVEAGQHFPSDVLAGAAIAHFLSAFIHDAFLGRYPSMTISLVPHKGGGEIRIDLRF